MTAALATAGHNQPPSELDFLKERFDLLEVENWLDGERVETDDQMKTVDGLIQTVKKAEKHAKDEKEQQFRPHKEKADAITEHWKPVLDDLSRMRTGLLALVGDYKKKRSAEQEAIRKAKEAEAERLAREAEAVKRNVDMGDIEQRREADAVSLEARKASKSASDVEHIKGMRTRTVAEIVDGRECINWIATKDRPAMLSFMQEYVNKKTREGVRGIGGVEVRQEKYAV